MNSDYPLVSIGLPVYNGKHYISATLKSLVEQSYENIEIIISDNASTDNSLELCHRYAKKAKRINIFEQRKDFGAAYNYNYVFRKSRGQYFKWAAHDDLCAPDLIEKCVSVLEENMDSVLCYTNMVNIDDRGSKIGFINRTKGLSHIPSKRFSGIIAKNYTCEEIFGLIRHDALKTTKLIRNYTDSDRTLLAELCIKGPFKKIEKNLLLHRVHEDMSTKVYNEFYERASWFDPQLKGKFKFIYLKQIMDYIDTIWFSNITISEKIKCSINLAKWVKWNEKWLRRELRLGYRNLKNRSVAI
jgi:glycosyltransferase involved in cell wall biosynthesis